MVLPMVIHNVRNLSECARLLMYINFLGSQREIVLCRHRWTSYLQLSCWLYWKTLREVKSPILVLILYLETEGIVIFSAEHSGDKGLAKLHLKRSSSHAPCCVDL